MAKAGRPYDEGPRARDAEDACRDVRGVAEAESRPGLRRQRARRQAGIRSGTPAALFKERSSAGVVDRPQRARGATAAESDAGGIGRRSGLASAADRAAWTGA